MREITSLNKDWAYHYGEIDRPKFLAKKSYAFGGLTAPLANEEGEMLPIGPGGKHFLNLISGGHQEIGLRNLAGTELLNSLDESWKSIDVPDDWKRREAYKDDPSILMQGSKPDGIAYYRRTFKLTGNLDENKKYVLHFDGIMGLSDIWFNGAYLGHNDSGYVSIDLDISELVRFAEDGINVILVRNDTTIGSEGWWYEGAGIYKEGKVNDEYLKYFDILGINYPEAGVMGKGAQLIHESHPDLPMISTENASYFSTRGIYKDNGEKCQCNNFGSMYSMVLPGKRKLGDPGVGGTAHPEEVMTYFKEHPYMGGVFLWTGLDYYGEPSPFGWPGISSQFGVCDLGAIPKDYYYYYQANWVNNPIIHIMPHWNKEGLKINEGKTPVRIFTNCDEVELFINNKSQGRQKVIDYQTNWNVLYEKGKLTAKAYAAEKLVTQTEKITSEKIDKIKVIQRYQGKETTIYELNAIDCNGNFVPTADSLVDLECNNGRIIGLTNGDPSDLSPYSLTRIRLFSGKAIVIVKHKENTDTMLKAKVK